MKLLTPVVFGRRFIISLVVLALLASVLTYGAQPTMAQSTAPNDSAPVMVSNTKLMHCCGTVYVLNSNAVVYQRYYYGGSGDLYTAPAGRGFRTNDTLYLDTWGRCWLWGHSAVRPDVDGYILAYHAGFNC
ncbi:MAG TPA: hypothetical protein VGD69_00775 [Herpetosiphonaceae bacterium]